MKKYFAIVILALLLFGCTGGGGQPQGQPPGQQPPVANQTPPVTPPVQKPSPFPMKFVYNMVNEMRDAEGRSWNQTIEITYWLEDEKKCNSRDAILGIMTMKEVGSEGMGQPYAKLTLYLDKGELAVSNWQQESDLSFDTAKPQAVEMDFILLMNYIFNGAGKNFMSDAIWNSTDPVILKEVTAFGSISNVSITKIGESTSGVVPCIEFSVAVRGSSGSSEQLKVCVAEITDTNPLPYVVYVKPKEGQMGPNWELKSVEKAKSNIAKYPQCLSPVTCPAFVPATQQDMYACNQQGGSLETVRDTNNCIIEYKCMSMREIAERDLKNMQGPECQVSSALVDELLACREQNKFNVDFERGQTGCITAVLCP